MEEDWSKDNWYGDKMRCIEKQLAELDALFKRVPDPFKGKPPLPATKPKLRLIKGGKYGT